LFPIRVAPSDDNLVGILAAWVEVALSLLYLFWTDDRFAWKTTERRTLDVSVVVVVVVGSNYYSCYSCVVSFAAVVAAAAAAAVVVVWLWRRRSEPSRVPYTFLFRSHTEPSLSCRANSSHVSRSSSDMVFLALDTNLATSVV